MSHHRRFALILCALSVLVGQGLAQQELFSVDAPPGADWYGFELRAAGDVNADGHGDIVLNFGESVLGNSPYVVHVLSGADGSVLHELNDPEDPDGGRWGAVISGAGDVDGDGFDDVMVSDTLYSDAPDVAGRVYVYSGLTGEVILDLVEVGYTALFGYDLAPAGDLDGDGHDDLIIASPYGEADGQLKDRVVVRSGADGSVLHDFWVPYEHGGPIFGRGVANGGDIDGDGVNDVLCLGAWFCEFASYALLNAYSGADGALIQSIVLPCNGFYAHRISAAGDVDGDGWGDILLGRGGSFITAIGGIFEVYSGATGEEIIEYWNEVGEGDATGHWVAAMGDLDHDGTDDLAVSAPRLPEQDGTGPGCVNVHSGVDQQVLATVAGEVPGDRFGYRFAPVDLDGDGYLDLAVSAPTDGDGRVVGFSLYQPFTAVGEGVPGALGLPRLAPKGLLAPGEFLRFHVSRGPADAPAIFVLGLSVAQVPFQAGVMVPFPDAVHPLQLDGAGQGTFEARLPQVLPGPFVFWTQAWIADEAAPGGLSATRGQAGAVPLSSR